MNCSNHVDREPIAMCVRCNKFICRECAVSINNKYYCKDCVSEMYSDKGSNEESINKEKVKDYADKAVDATIDVTNEALNFVKDFSKSEKVKSTVNTIKQSNNQVKILAIIAIILLVPKMISNLEIVVNVVENIYLSFRYNEIIRGFIFVINGVISLIQPIVLVILAILPFNNFINFSKKFRTIAPIIVLIAFTLIRFILGNIAIRFIDINPIIDMFSYIMPVALISISGYLDNE